MAMVGPSLRVAHMALLLVLAQRPDLAWNGCCTAVPWCCAWVRALDGWTCYPSPVLYTDIATEQPYSSHVGGTLPKSQVAGAGVAD